MSTQIQKTQSISNFLNMPSTAKFLHDTLAEKKPEFVSNLIALCDADTNLAKCAPADLMKCALNATSLNLPLNKNLGYAYVIPYKGVPSFQIGYKGLIQLAIRTGQYKFINATEIRDGEIERNKITGEIKYLGEKDDSPIVGYMAYLELMTGFTASYYMSEDQVEAHALKYSKMYQYDKSRGGNLSKWSDPDARPGMCKKTVLKLLLGTYGLMTTEFARALDSDDESVESTNAHRFEEADIVQQDEPTEVVHDEAPKTMKI